MRFDELERLGALDRYQRAINAVRVPPSERLPDGSVGWYGAPGRTDDCFRAGLATCLQVAPSEVPDPHIDRRLDRGESPDEINRVAWAALLPWLQRRGLAMVVHETITAPMPGRWIAVAPPPIPQPFADHTLVMVGDRVLFDPALAWFVRRQALVKEQLGFRDIAAERMLAYRATTGWPSTLDRGFSFTSIKNERSTDVD